MYDNPIHIKDVRINVRINELQEKRLMRVADLQQVQKSTFARDALLKYIAELEEQYSEELEPLTDRIG